MGIRFARSRSKIALLPSAEHSVNGDDTIDSWQLHDLENPRTYRLRTTDVPMAVPPSQRPILTPSDLGCSGYRVPFRFLTLNVEYAYPVMSWYPLGHALCSEQQGVPVGLLSRRQRRYPAGEDLLGPWRVDQIVLLLSAAAQRAHRLGTGRRQHRPSETVGSDDHRGSDHRAHRPEGLLLPDVPAGTPQPGRALPVRAQARARAYPPRSWINSGTKASGSFT